jgi:hypothetical protein
MKRDSPVLGFVIGLFLPFVGMIIMYFLWGHGQGFGAFLKSLTFQPGLASKVITLSLLPNLVPFVYCNMKRIDLTMRGIVIATMIYALFIILIKFVW